MADRNQIIKGRYNDILLKKMKSQKELTDLLTDKQLMECFHEISPLFGTQISESRVRKQLTRLINRMVGDN